jgi:hypothetical protein
MPAGDINEVANGVPRLRMLYTMAKFFEVVGYVNIRARVAGYVPPPIVEGKLEDHRPDMLAQWRNTVVLVDVWTPQMVEAGGQPRLELFGSWAAGERAQGRGTEIHFVVPSWSKLGEVEQKLRRRLERAEVTPNKVWTL